ncbi:MAG: class II fructose-bisphosphatase [Candidatus Gracilibacteria bacterium]|nr:class II fructose-bisphosphatase [Candidatus Gracilibacteria bacterium]
MLNYLISQFVRATEAAAIESARSIGKGDAHYADKLATEALRKILNSIDIDARIVIGEGERDEAPMLYIGEELGTKNGPRVDIAVDPLEGTNLCAAGLDGAIAVMAISEQGGLLHAPDMYMQKLVVGPKLKGKVSINAPTQETLKIIAKTYKIPVDQVTVVVLDRPRHADLIKEIRETGARIKLITDGDVSAGLDAAFPDNNIHAVMGIGAAPEGVIKAAAMKAMGGEIQAIFKPKDKEQVERMQKMGITDIEKVYFTDDLAPGDDILFVATGITHSVSMPAVEFQKGAVKTYSVIMDSKTQTIRFLQSIRKDPPLR